MFKEEIINDIIKIVHTKPEYAQALEELQYIVFPNLAADEILKKEQYVKHLEIFPEGQLVALDNNKVIGGSTTMRYHFDLENPVHHTFSETSAGGWLTNHDPNGEWLYGIDVSVHPDYRGKGIAKAFYRIRNQIARELNLKGQLGIGMLNGYINYKEKMTIDEYYKKVKEHEIFDPTVSVQEKIGFELKGLMKDYLNDPTCGNAGAIIVLKVNM
ncbi:MAG: GNAT family N-acetyltransferase [Fimbriimonadaceae bacterium]|nr:GNAT family N-acetyltransferase [Chitinophagales bacterium]